MRIRIRDLIEPGTGYPGSGINIPAPQHCNCPCLTQEIKYFVLPGVSVCGPPGLLDPKKIISDPQPCYNNFLGLKTLNSFMRTRFLDL
jgi:hypothetical protein